MKRYTTAVALVVAATVRLSAQDAGTPERWNLYYQATSIGQYHPAFQAPYKGTNSLESYSERDVSLTTTLFFTLRLDPDTQLVFDPEIAGGRGFSRVTGFANPTNGELPRVAAATPKPYLARAYFIHDFALGSGREPAEADANQLGGSRPALRYTVAVGRFTLTDFFDNNRYTHDPRTQFMAWGTMYNGAWDYPADTRGYTWGWLHELHLRDWSFRYASAAEPSVANGPRFDRRLFRDRGDVVEAESRFKINGMPGTVRVLGFRNATRSGSYRDALAMTGTPDVTAIRKPGTTKYGVGVNFEQELAKDLGVFGRAGWADGRNEDFAFTAIDHIVTGGLSLSGGGRWGRTRDSAATAVSVSGVSSVHEKYLARGGVDFLLGDGKLAYGRETNWETYYSAAAGTVGGLATFVTFDVQRIWNPAYNRDRGPVWALSLRLHVEGGQPRH